MILAGHQPELVHPGVWFKNFVLSSLAQRTAAHAVNLLIDNDAVRSTSIRSPAGSVRDPVTAFVPLDDSSAPIPFEERRILNASVFESFGKRTADLVRPLIRARCSTSSGPGRSRPGENTAIWDGPWPRLATFWKAGGG